MKIALLSDTHGYLDKAILKYLTTADEIWHAGDIGSKEVLEQLQELPGKIKIVHGNIDNQQLRLMAPENQVFETSGAKILLTHIAGTPPRYNKKVKVLIEKHRPNILVCGHSHILKVKHDTHYNLLYINPGACGNHGFHKMRTIILFEITNAKPKNMRVIELGKRGIL